MPVKAKRALICGYYGFANAGDEAMLMAVIDALADLEPELKIAVLSGNPRETAARHGVKAVHRLNVLAIIVAMLKADIVISGGGSLLQDVTSRRSIFYYLGVMLLAKLLGKPVMLYGQGIGPIRGALARKLTAFVCRRADALTVRDKKSAQELADLGVEPQRVVLTADPVMAMHPVDKHSGRMLLRDYRLEGASPLVGICARDWQGLSSFKQELARAADRLIQECGARIIFLPLQYPDDLVVSREIALLMREKENVAVLEQRCGISDFLSLVGNLDLLLGVRLHALIFGAVMRVPVVGVSYDPKIDGFLAGIDSAPVGKLEEITAGRLVERAKEALGDASILARQQACVAALKDSALGNARLAVALLDKKRR